MLAAWCHAARKDSVMSCGPVRPSTEREGTAVAQTVHFQVSP